jgi:hypothetical protein
MTTQLPDHTARPPELDSFERELLAELRSVVFRRNAGTAGPASQARRRRRMRLAAATGSAVVAALAGGSLLAGGSPAFAVEPGPSGAVVIRIHEFKDASALESALAEQGVEAAVDYSGHGSSLTVDEQGNVSPDGPDLPADGSLTPSDPVPMDATFTDDASSGCGLTTAGESPITLERDGEDYLVTLAGPTVTSGSALKLSTATGPHGDTIVATYQFGGARCGAMLTR